LVGNKLKINQSENETPNLRFYCDYLFFKFYPLVILFSSIWQQVREAKVAKEEKEAREAKLVVKLENLRNPLSPKSARAGLQFPVGRIHRFLKEQSFS
jgi:hypothetical protein